MALRGNMETMGGNRSKVSTAGLRDNTGNAFALGKYLCGS